MPCSAHRATLVLLANQLAPCFATQNLQNLRTAQTEGVYHRLEDHKPKKHKPKPPEESVNASVESVNASVLVAGSASDTQELATSSADTGLAKVSTISSMIHDWTAGNKAKESAPATTPLPPFVQKDLTSRLKDFVIWFVFTIAFAYYYSGNGKRKITRFLLPKWGEPLEDGGHDMRAYKMFRENKEWAFSLWSFYKRPKLLCFSCCCLPVRWADTVDLTGIYTFWGALEIFVWVNLAALMTDYFVSYVFLLMFLTYMRQKIRVEQRLPSGGIKNIIRDFLTFLFCMPCAVTQEARQLELVTKVKEEGKATISPKPTPGGTPREDSKGYAPTQEAMNAPSGRKDKKDRQASRSPRNEAA